MTYSFVLEDGLQEPLRPIPYVGPKPLYRIRCQPSNRVPMRDGTRLSTDLYFPEGLDGPLAVILLRTPYNKNSWRSDPLLMPRLRLFVAQGYICAVQDKRGRFESEGEYVLARGDAEDGYDTIDWLIHQPWCDGNIGTYGCSYMGELQIYQAKLRHPNLKAMIPCAAGGAVGTLGGRYTRWGARFGGALSLATLVGWMHGMGSKVYARLPAALGDETFQRLATRFETVPVIAAAGHDRALEQLPVQNILNSLDLPPNDFDDIVCNEQDSDYWDQFDYYDEEDRIDVPTLLVDSWFDTCVADTLLLYQHFRSTALSDNSRQNQFLIIAPGVHCKSEYATARTQIGERHFGDARYPHWQLYLDWFDYWLRGHDNGVIDRPRVTYYLMGMNEWKTSDHWPLPGTNSMPWYLHSNGHANSLDGDGALSLNAPGEEPHDSFDYDPDCFVPTLGGPVCPSPGLASGGAAQFGAEPGCFDQRENESRDDILIYTSTPLKTAVTIAGAVKAVLFVSSSAQDTDFTAKLVEVDADGHAWNIQEGIIRCRFRTGYGNKVWFEAGEVYRIEIDLQATAIQIPSGHCIRLEVSSSNFPRFDRNLNTGGNNFDETEWLVARNSVHHSNSYLSHLLLPVVGNGETDMRVNEL